MKHLTSILAFLILITIGLACSGSDETQKANDIVKEANKALIEANSAAEKAIEKGSEFDKKVNNVKSEEDLKSARDFGKDISKLYDTMEGNFKNAADKFEEAGKLKINEKFKEYLELKAKEMKKRAEYSVELKKVPKALDDAQNEKAYRQAIATIIPNVQKMTKEAQEIGDKADKIIKDNPTIIKPAE